MGCLFLCSEIRENERSSKYGLQNKAVKLSCHGSRRQSDSRDRMVLSGINHPSAYLRKMEMDGYVINLDLSELKEILRLCGINS